MKFSLSKDIILSPLCMSIGILLLFIPTLYSLGSFLSRNSHLKEVEQRIHFFQEKQQRKDLLIRKENKIISQIYNANPHFLKDAIYSLPFLETKRQQQQFYLLQAKADAPTTLEPDLEFQVQSSQSTEFFQETKLSQAAPILVSAEELRTLLRSLEDNKNSPYSSEENAPPILIYSFSLEKTPHPKTGEKQFSVLLHFLQRTRNPS